MDPTREAYPFAGALCVATGELLSRAHEHAGPPQAQGLKGSAANDAMVVAAALTYGAAAACAALAARLLLIQREQSRTDSAALGAPAQFELGVTTLEATPLRAWRATVRAAAAARAELDSAAAGWSATDLDATALGPLLELLARIARYIDDLAVVLERMEPDGDPPSDGAVR